MDSDRQLINSLRTEEINLRVDIVRLKSSLEDAKIENRRLLEIEELEDKNLTYEHAIQEANQVNNTLSAHYQLSKKEIRALKQKIEQQE